MFTIEQLSVAYRKAKVDLYYSVSARELELLDYESSLGDNLQSLLERINGESTDWVTDPKFLGRYSVVPKKLNRDADHIPCPIIWSNHEDQLSKFSGSKPEAIFRIISRCSIDLHVLSTLWLMTAGAKLEAALSDRAMGNRIRRTKDGTVNLLSIGSFQPYLKPFSEWREKGLKAIEKALTEDKKVVALTGDVQSFYHKLNIAFIADEKYLEKVIPSGLSAEERHIHSLFVRALREWAEVTGLALNVKPVGLPVGLPASAVVANLALIELDRYIENQLTPLYYGRYVDDIFLVIEQGIVFDAPRELWSWIIARAPKELGLKSSEDGLEFSPQYLTGSEVKFHNEKNKIFGLEGSTGKALISSIRRAISDQGSEWRSLPQLPSSSSDVGTRMVVALQRNGSPVVSLHRAENISAKRAQFALQLRDFESFQRDLPLDVWSNYREAFFESVQDYALSADGFFELWTYLPRLLRLALVCDEIGAFSKMLATLRSLTKSIGDHTNPELASVAVNGETILREWKNQLDDLIINSIAAAVQETDEVIAQEKFKKVAESYDSKVLDDWLASRKIVSTSRRLFYADLAHLPFRNSILPPYLSSYVGAERTEGVTPESLPQSLPKAIIDGKNALQKVFSGTDPSVLERAVLYPTRPFNVAELYISARPFRESAAESTLADLALILLAVRGYNLEERIPKVQVKGGGSFISIDDDNQHPPGKRRIAIGSLETQKNQADRAASGMPDLGLARHRRVSAMINELLSRENRVDYLVLPELSVPVQWFIKIAQKLGSRGISLITGVEYIPDGRGSVQNEVWASLQNSQGAYRSSIIYRQDKQSPAPGELESLSRLAGLTLKPAVRWKQPPVISHSGFIFSIVICSELTNIDYRSALRGKIDALFVPQWNRDLHTFEALVESASLDIHAYVIQANNRTYGDSRIRVPAAEEWERDIVRHRGGIHDYTVIGEIDLTSLRRHQSVHRMTKPKFKPLPHGFEVSENRLLSAPVER